MPRFLIPLVLLVVARWPAHAQPPPQDPFRACALKVLAGAYPGAAAWKVDWYKRGLAEKRAVQGRCKQTFFGPFESDTISGGPFCWVGSTRIRLTEDHAASNPELPKGSVVWTPNGIRCVVDRGGLVKLRYCWKGETLNLDYYGKRDPGTLHGAPYVILRRGWGS